MTPATTMHAIWNHVCYIEHMINMIWSGHRCLISSN